MINLTNMIKKPIIVRRQNNIQKIIFAMFLTIIIGVLLIYVEPKVNIKQCKLKNDTEVNQTITKVFNEGTYYGYLIAITNIMLSSQNCNIVPLNYINVTKNMIDINCVG